MDSLILRKAATAGLVAAALVGFRMASASGAGQPQEIFIGEDTVEQCSSSQIAVDYDVAYDAALRGYGVAAAQLSGLAEQCQGYLLTVSLSGPGGAQLAEMTTVVDGEAMRVEVPAATPVSAERLAGVSLVLRSAEG